MNDRPVQRIALAENRRGLEHPTQLRYLPSGQNGQEAIMRRWQVQEAKARFSDLVREAVQSGPQEITVRGRPTSVVLSSEDYERLSGRKPSLVEFLRASPLAGIELEIERDRSPRRSVDL